MRRLRMNAKKMLKGAESIAVLTGATLLSAYVWLPIGPIVTGFWYFKRRWRKGKGK